MAIDDLAENLRLLCSYGRSTSDVCRRAGLNRQQFNKYLNGHARPSLSTLRRICDFFGVDDHEILLDAKDFREIIKLRPPRLGADRSHLDEAIDRLIAPTDGNEALFKAHEGYYHAYSYPEPSVGYYLRSLYRLYCQEGHWFVKSLDRRLDERFMLPATLKYTGIAIEGFQRIAVFEREQGVGRSLHVTFLYASEQAAPSYLPGLTMSSTPEGSHHIYCVRTVWHYLGRKPNLREALGKCGVVDLTVETLPDIVIEYTDNRMREGDTVLMPRL